MAEHALTIESMLLSLLDEKKYASLRDILTTINPADIAAIFEDLEQDRLPLLFRLLPKELAAETFVEMDPETQELLIQGFSDNELKEVIDELYVDDAVDMMEELPANVVKRVMRTATPETRSISIGLKRSWITAKSILQTRNTASGTAISAGTVCPPCPPPRVPPSKAPSICPAH